MPEAWSFKEHHQSYNLAFPDLYVLQKLSQQQQRELKSRNVVGQQSCLKTSALLAIWQVKSSSKIYWYD